MVRNVCLLYGHCRSYSIDQEISRHRLERLKKMVRRESQGIGAESQTAQLLCPLTAWFTITNQSVGEPCSFHKRFLSPWLGPGGIVA